MADLRRFINPALRPNEKISFYVRGVRLGGGDTQKIETLNAQLSGSIFGFDLAIEIEMPDTSPSGTCTLTMNGGKPEDCPYRTTSDNKLHISREDKTEILIYVGDRAYTFVDVTNRPTVGVWPDRIKSLEESEESAPLAEAAD